MSPLPDTAPETARPCLPKALAESPVFLLGRLGFELKRRAYEELEAAGASLWDYGVLAVLAEGTCGAQSSIADRLRLDRSQLVGLLDGLEERGLVERRRDPEDRRRHAVSLTPKGAEELTRLRAIVEALEDEVLAPLDSEERAELGRLLRCVASRADGRSAPRDEPVAVR